MPWDAGEHHPLPVPQRLPDAVGPAWSGSVPWAGRALPMARAGKDQLVKSSRVDGEAHGCWGGAMRMWTSEKPD